MIEDIKKEYAANGFVIVRNAIDLGLANEIETWEIAKILHPQSGNCGNL